MSTGAKSRVPLIALTVVLGALALVLGEVDRLGSQAGVFARFSILKVTGPGALAHMEQWRTGWATGSGWWRLEPFIEIFIVLDLVFIAAYATVVLLLTNRLLPQGQRGAPRGALAALVAVDLLENALLYAAAGVVQTERGVPDSMALWIAWASTAKWLVLLVLVVVVVRRLARSGRLASVWRSTKRGVVALYVQRMLTLFVVVLIVLNALPLHPILEQVPDLQRGWLDSRGHGHAVAALLVLAALAATLWFIGWSTAQRAVGSRSVRTGWNYAIWAFFPAAVAIGALAAYIASPQAGTQFVDTGRLRVFLAISLGALMCSAVVGLIGILAQRRRAHNDEGSAAPNTVAVSGYADLVLTRRAAAVLSGLVIVVPALGLVRSLSTGAILWFAAPERQTGWTPPDRQLVEPPLVPLLVALASLLASILLLCLATASTAVEDADWIGEVGSSRRWYVIAAAICATLTAVIVAVVVAPSWVAGLLGPFGVAFATLGAWVGIMGMLAVFLSFRAPLGIFRIFGLRADPVLLIFLLVPFLVPQLTGTADLHGISRASDPAPLERSSLAGALDGWLARNAGCFGEVQRADGTAQAIRPLALVAAEGGGIRAAVWTVSALSEFVSSGACVSNSVFLSSGVSGGSVGLAVASNHEWTGEQLAEVDPDGAEEMGQQMRAAVYSLGRSTALAVAIGGLVVIDPLASTTGIRLPSLESDWAWRDRASLIEHSWRTAYDPLQAPFGTVPSAPTGLVVLNATDIRSGCRVAISQVQLGPGTSGLPLPEQPSGPDPVANCGSGLDEPALTIDMVDLFARCSGRGTDWAAAALLSARFPYVTPSGTIGSGNGACGRPRLQIVDGGYAENSGIGLLADTAPRLARVIQAYNTFARQPGEPLVVPFVVYLQNSPRALSDPAGIDDTSELLVPFSGFGAKSTQVTPATWVQRTLASVEHLCVVPPPLEAGDPGASTGISDAVLSVTDCESEAAAASGTLNAARRVVVVQADVEPSIAVPLGWGLSDASYCQLAYGAAAQAVRRTVGSLPSGGSALGDYFGLFPDAHAYGINQARTCRATFE